MSEQLSRGQYGDKIKPTLGLFVGEEARNFSGWMSVTDAVEQGFITTSVPAEQLNWVTWDTTYGWLRCPSPTEQAIQEGYDPPIE